LRATSPLITLVNIQGAALFRCEHRAAQRSGQVLFEQTLRRGASDGRGCQGGPWRFAVEEVQGWRVCRFLQVNPFGALASVDV
jgi:hypothetical protein